MRFLIATLFFCFSATLLAQEQCGSDVLMMGMPRSQRMIPPPEIDLDTAEVIVVPVVFHIVHKGETIGEGTNISDEQIQSCVTALNEDFRKIEGTNGDGLGVDTKIEFCLASRSPDNSPTTGIVRHDASDLVYEVTFSGQYQMVTYMEDGVTSSGAFTSSLQGVPADWMKQQLGCWDTEKYLNMWIVSEIDGNDGGGGIQGFSYVGHYPSNCFAGPVQLYNVTGTIGNIKTGNLNKTTTHEIGHAFNLYHTFGFLGSSCTETNCETQGDQVCDTPPTTANYGCSPSSCPDAQVNNYMDYTSQTCRNTFTQGQAERMREELWTQLNGFTQSLGCVPVSDLDGGITAMGLVTPNCKTTFPVSVTIANFGTQDLHNPTITLTNGTNVQSSTLDLTLVTGQTHTASIEFTSLSSATIDAEVIFEETESYTANNIWSVDFVYQEGNALLVEVSPDVWSNEVDWTLYDENGEAIVSDGDWPVFSQDSVFTKEVCLYGGCYTFEMTDTNGDGLCQWDFDDDGICDGGFGDVFVHIYLNDELIYDLSDPSELDFGSELVVTFCDQIVECEGDVDGDNMVGVNDLLVMLSNVGCISEGLPCEGDLNGDGTTDVNDLNEVLAHYGETCSGLVLLEENNPPVSEQKPVSSLAKTSQNRMGFYDLSGRWVGNDRERLRQGIYILVELKDGDFVQSKVFIQ
jgi:hypothetical protein